MIRIQYSNSKRLAGIYYGDDLINSIYLDVNIGKPSFVYSEEGDEMPDGSFSRNYALIKKQYNIESYFMEYMVDAISIIGMHDNIQVETESGQVFLVDEFTMSSPEWIDGMAKVTLTFVVYSEYSSGCGEDDICETIAAPIINYITYSYSGDGGIIMSCQYIEYVTDNGGTINDETSLYDTYAFLEAPNEISIILADVEVQENTLNTVYVKETGGSYVESGTFSDAEINGGSATVTTELCADPYYIKILSYTHGCDGTESEEYELAIT